MAKKNPKNLTKQFVGKPLPEVEAISADASAVQQGPRKKKQVGNYKRVDSQFADAFRDILPVPDNVAQMLAKTIRGDARMSNESLDDQQKVMLWDVIQNAKKRTGKPDGGTEYQDYGGLGYGDSEQFNNWFNRGKYNVFEGAYNSLTNPGFKLGSTIGRGKYFTDPENPDKMYYTDVYDWNAHEKNFPGTNIYQKVRNTLRAGEDPNLTADKNENYRMNFELDAKEIEKLRKSMQPPSMENGGWLDKYNDGGPVQPNYNDYSVSAPEGFQGDGYSNVGRNYSPAWGGQFAMGGSMPGAVGHMYSRQGSGTAQPGDADYNAPRTGEIPDNGKYAKKTKASAQDGKTIYSGMLPEITVVGSKDPQTEEYYRTMLDRLTKEEGYANGISSDDPVYNNPEAVDTVYNYPNATDNILGRYEGLMDLGKKYGFPKVHPVDKNSLLSKMATTVGGDSRPPANYDASSKTIQADSTKDWVSEMAHHIQMKDNRLNKTIQWMKNDLPALAISEVMLGNRFGQYHIPGTVEYEAHSVIEPKLLEEMKKSESQYKKLPYRQKKTDEFYGDNFYKNLGAYQNGGEMKFYQEGLDFQPKTISRNGSVIKDDMGQWAHPGEITEIGSNQITMQGVPYPVLGISDTGDTQMMYPNQDYTYQGSSVTEYPMMKEGGALQLTKLDQLTNFTNYNTKQPGGWLDKYQD
jgi:hypothetical protein